MATLIEQATALLALCRRKRLKIATAESCTGGLIAATLTEIPGSSDVVERGFVTYSNEAKETMLGVPGAMLRTVGAVSRETAEAMAKGALRQSHAELAISVTGIAGPGGGSPEKPVGLVHFAAASKHGHLVHHEKHFGDIGRSQVRHASVIEALAMLRELAEGYQPR
ncbi:MAG: CinA family protein [Xanthobacteraceae bacterium]|nr:CinA family protein [Xanthobacteraceae bacterium]